MEESLRNRTSSDVNFKKFTVKYDKLCKYLADNEHVFPNESSDKELFNWIRNTRRFHKNGKLENRRIALLEAIDFPFSANKTIIVFKDRVKQLLQYKKEHGSLHVSQTLYERGTVNYSLSRWVNEMRRKFSENRLGFEYVEKLEKIDFLWNMDDVRFEKKLKALKRFHKNFGHYDIPQKGKTKKIGNWVAGIRSRGIKTERHEKWLNDIGFVWIGIKKRKRQSLEKMAKIDLKVMAQRLKQQYREKNKSTNS